MVTAPGCPCQSCKNRHLGCHGSCCGYLEWTKKQKDLKSKERKAILADRYGNDWMGMKYAKKPG